MDVKVNAYRVDRERELCNSIQCGRATVVVNKQTYDGAESQNPRGGFLRAHRSTVRLGHLE